MAAPVFFRTAGIVCILCILEVQVAGLTLSKATHHSERAKVAAAKAGRSAALGRAQYSSTEPDAEEAEEEEPSGADLARDRFTNIALDMANAGDEEKASGGGSGEPSRMPWRGWEPPGSHLVEAFTPNVGLSKENAVPAGFENDFVPTSPEAERYTSMSDIPITVVDRASANAAENFRVVDAFSSPFVFRGSSCLQVCLACEKKQKSVPSCACSVGCSFGGGPPCGGVAWTGWTKDKRTRPASEWKATCAKDEADKSCDTCVTDADRRTLEVCGSDSGCVARLIHEMSTGDMFFYCSKPDAGPSCEKLGTEPTDNGWTCFRTKESCQRRGVVPSYDDMIPALDAPSVWAGLAPKNPEKFSKG